VRERDGELVPLAGAFLSYLQRSVDRMEKRTDGTKGRMSHQGEVLLLVFLVVGDVCDVQITILCVRP